MVEHLLRSTLLWEEYQLRVEHLLRSTLLWEEHLLRSTLLQEEHLLRMEHQLQEHSAMGRASVTGALCYKRSIC